MKLYIDDDLAGPRLAELLRRAANNVQLPKDVVRSGMHDAIHLRHAIREQRVLLTRNHDDFQYLHELVLEVKGHHPGILVVREGDNPKRNMRFADIVRAIGKLEVSGAPIADQYIILNHWQ